VGGLSAHAFNSRERCLNAWAGDPPTLRKNPIKSLRLHRAGFFYLQNLQLMQKKFVHDQVY
jgi:hypothetical protein